MVLFSFLGGTLGHGRPAICASCSLSVCACLSVHLFIILSGDHFFSELKSMRGNADQVADVRNRRASIPLPINSFKTANIKNTPFGLIENALG